MTRRELFLDLGIFLLLALVVLAFFWPLLLAGRWIPRGGGDLVSFIWPMYRFAARSLRSGTVPLWNPHLYSGAPFVADNQSGVFYPINLLAFALWGEPTYGVIEGLAVFHVWLAGANLILLLRGLGLRRRAALFGGVAFALSDLFVTHVGNLNLSATAAWLPLLLLLAHRALTERRPEHAATAGVVLAVAALAGHGQMLLFLALSLVLYTAYRLAVDWRLGWRHRLSTLALLGLVVVVGVGGSALTLFPAWEMAGHTGRGQLPYEEATRYSLPPQALIGLVAPGFYGRGSTHFWAAWDRVEVGYLGIPALALAVAALGLLWIPRRFPEVGSDGLGESPAGGRSRGVFLFFALLVPVAYLLAMGRYTPVYRLAYRFLPTFDQVRAPARLILLADLGLAALAGYGLDRLLADGEGRWGRWVARGMLIAGIGVVALGLPLARLVPSAGRVGPATRSILIAAGLLGAGGVVVWLSRRFRWAGGLLLLLLVVDLVGLGSTLEAEPNDPTLGFGHHDVVAFLREDDSLFRIDSATGAWQPDGALAHGLYDVGGVYNPLELAPYYAYRHWGIPERGHPLYNLLGVKYVLATKGEPPGDQRFVLVYEGNPHIDVYLNTVALPRAFLVYRSSIVADHATAWEAIHDPGFDPAGEVILERGRPLASEPGGGETVVSFVHYGVNEVLLAVRTPVQGILVLSDVYYPGWRATVDGQPAEIRRANYVFRAVKVPAGEHLVRMAFEPPTWRLGLAVSGVVWAGLALWVVCRLTFGKSRVTI